MNIFLSIIVILCSIREFVISNSQECDVKHLEWMSMTSYGGSYAPNASLSISVDSTLNLNLIVDLDYIGDSSVNGKEGYGTTYVIDFESYKAYDDQINIPNNCQNRISSSFESKTFSQYWGYSTTPYIENHLGNENYLSYPPTGDLWNITMKPISYISSSTNQITMDLCKTIRYQAVIPWMTLLGCTNKHKENSIILTENDYTINASGTLYVNVVSPYDNIHDSGLYRVYQLISQPFIVTFQKMINVMSSIGIQLFRISILSVYMEGSEIDNDNYFRLIILTESADYLQLLSPHLILYPNNGVNYQSKAHPLTTGCLVSQSYTCGQIWEIYAETNCPPSNFSGQYGLQWTATCSVYGSKLCETYLEEYSNLISLTVPLTFIDQFCDPYIYSVILNGEMYFYDKTFQYKYDINNNSYPIGDTAYIEIIINYPESTYDIFQIELINIFLCTYDDNYPIQNITINQITGNGGCIDSNIDSDGPYTLMMNKEIKGYDTKLIDITNINPNSNIVRFSFTIPSLVRTTMYVHTQLQITLMEGLDNERDVTTKTRRITLDIDDIKTADRMGHFGGMTNIVPRINNDENNNNNNQSINNSTWIITAIIISGLFGIGIIILLSVYFCKCEIIQNIKLPYQINSKTKKNKYSVNTGVTHSTILKPPNNTTNSRKSSKNSSCHTSRSPSINDVILDAISDSINLDLNIYSSGETSEKLD